MPLPCTEEQIGNTFLTIRYATSDDGSRPIPDGRRHSGSPDIWIDHGGDPAASDALTAYVGGENVITVRVWNFTTKTFQDLNVEAWVRNYALGAVGPNTHIPSAGISSRIGFEQGPLPPGASVEIPCG